MHLKVVLQGNLGYFGSEYSASKIYGSEGEFRELRRLIGNAELAVAERLARIGEHHWPEIDVILCNFWCRTKDIEGETIRHYRKDKLLEASTCIEAGGFKPQLNPKRCNIFFYRALTLSAAGFRKYKRDGAEIELIRNERFSEGAPGEF
jgi:hypothetical protein